MRHFGALAQLGERLLCKQKVIGSNPICSTIYMHVKLLAETVACCESNPGEPARWFDSNHVRPGVGCIRTNVGLFISLGPRI